jgi:hypothetical protein
MVRKIGNFLLVIVLIIMRHLNGVSVQMVATDVRSRSLSSVQAGAPFLLKVTVAGVNRTMRPVIQHLDQLMQESFHTTTNVKIINGTTSSEVVYTYRVRASSPGSFTIGPAFVEYEGQHVSSLPLTINVVKRDQQQSSEQTRPAWLELSAAKESVMVGESVALTLKFFHEPEVRLAHSLTAQWAGWQIHQQTDSHQTTAVINGKEYVVDEMRLMVVRSEPGSYRLAGLSATCLVPAMVEEDDFFSFGFFGRPTHQQYRVSSNGLTLEVKPLPPYEGTVQGIGQLDSINCRVDQPYARVGEGLVLHYALEGSGDAASFKAPVLQLPEQFTFYASKTTVRDQDNNRWTKEFEYIVQATQAGSLEIPSQSYIYFDTATQHYQTLQSRPISLTIEAGVTAPRMVEPQSPVQPAIPSQKEPGVIHEEARWWYKSVALLAMAGVFTLLSMLVWFIRRWYRNRYATYIQCRQAFKRARGLLAQAQHNKQAVHIHAIFVELLSCIGNVSGAEISREWLEVMFEHAQFDEYQREQWQKDFALFTECAFAQQPRIDDGSLFKAAFYWIGEFEKKMCYN